MPLELRRKLSGELRPFWYGPLSIGATRDAYSVNGMTTLIRMACEQLAHVGSKPCVCKFRHEGVGCSLKVPRGR